LARFSKAFVSLNNGLKRLRLRKVSSEELLLLFPACLQNSACDAKITKDISNCRRCGKCKVMSILEMAEHYGVRAVVATGGELALQEAKGKDVRGIVAIACEKELRQGIMAAFPKPVLGVVNLRLHGPCKDTDVSMEEAEDAVRRFLRDAPEALQPDLPPPEARTNRKS
jgi:hypothetical protein